MYLLKKKQNLSLEDFKNYWLTKHVPIVLKLPNLRRYVVSVSIDERSEFAGVAELWFENREEMRAALKSDVGKEMVSDASNFVESAIMLVVEENVIR